MVRCASPSGRHAAQAGFTYLWLLWLVGVMSLGLAAVGEHWSRTLERQRREELAWVGRQYVEAIQTYQQIRVNGAQRFPRTLEELLEDDRLMVRRRHLRRLYVDPYTGRADWRLVRAPDGGVMGVTSAAPSAERFVATALVSSAAASH